MAELLKGKPVVDSMALDLRARIEALGRAKVVPALALGRVGQRPDDLSYERTARKPVSYTHLCDTTGTMIMSNIAQQSSAGGFGIHAVTGRLRCV